MVSHLFHCPRFNFRSFFFRLLQISSQFIFAICFCLTIVRFVWCAIIINLVIWFGVFVAARYVFNAKSKKRNKKFWEFRIRREDQRKSRSISLLCKVRRPSDVHSTIIHPNYSLWLCRFSTNSYGYLKIWPLFHKYVVCLLVFFIPIPW